MKDHADKERNVLLIAAAVGVIAGIFVYVALGWVLAVSGIAALIIALIVAVALWTGWRTPQDGAAETGQAASGGNAEPSAGHSGPAGSPTRTHDTGKTAAGSTSTATPPVMTQTAGGAGAAVAPPVAVQPPSEEAAAAASDRMDDSAARNDRAATDDAAGVSAPADAETAAPAPRSGGGAAMKPSARLAGQEELASRKGTWTYDPKAGASEAEARPDAAEGPTAHPGAAGASVVAATQAPGAMNGESAAAIAAREDAPDAAGAADAGEGGDKPAMLSGPRDGGPDNLKEIKGVGPKLESMLHEMGIYHFDQIAAWSTTEVAWMDGNLKGFRGRVSRDGWVEQAKVLAAGGETEFSRRVDQGGVY